MSGNTFKKTERLKSKKLLDELFESGKSFHVAPLKLVYREISGSPSPVQMTVSVPKRIFKRAVDRNKLKRRIRESFRLHKRMLYGSLVNKQLAIMFVYTSKEIKLFKEIDEKVLLSLQRLIKVYE